MSDSTVTSLPLDLADFGGVAAGVACTSCGASIATEYYERNGSVICGTCAQTQAVGGGTSVTRFLRALASGTLAAAAGAALYFGVAKLTGYEFGLMAIVVGFAVGTAVRWGSYGRGGWRYQALAMTLTYVSIVATYFPATLEATGSVVSATVFAIEAPFLTGVENIIGIVIVGIGLYEAWTLTNRDTTVITGPHAVTGGTRAVVVS